METRQGLSCVVRIPAEQVGDRSTDNDRKPGRGGRSTHAFIGLDAGNLPSHIFPGSLPIAGAAILKHLKSFEHWRFR